MSKKNVTIHIVDYTGVESFAEILLDPRFNSPFQITQYKTTELKFVESKPNGIIMGLFVTTQKKVFHQLINLEKMTIQQFH